MNALKPASSIAARNAAAAPGRAQRKVERPSAGELHQLMVDVGNWTTLATHFGVSDNAVRKWAKGYGLDLALCNGRRKHSLTNR